MHQTRRYTGGTIMSLLVAKLKKKNNIHQNLLRPHCYSLILFFLIRPADEQQHQENKATTNQTRTETTCCPLNVRSDTSLNESIAHRDSPHQRLSVLKYFRAPTQIFLPVCFLLTAVFAFFDQMISFSSKNLTTAVWTHILIEC